LSFKFGKLKVDSPTLTKHRAQQRDCFFTTACSSGYNYHL